MLGYVTRRILRMFLSLLVVSVLTFGLLEAAPGNFVEISAAGGASALSETMQNEFQLEMESRYGMDKPAWQRYLIFMKGALLWDFGPSYKYPTRTIQEIIAKAFPISARMAIISVAIALLIAVPLGVLAAVRQNSGWDYGSMFVLTTIDSLPNYLIAVFLVLVFSVQLKLLPSTGWMGPKYMILPVIALATGPVARLARYVRSSMLETLRKEYITAVRARGGGPFDLYYRHALRNSLIPLVTVLGPQLARLMTGTLFIEAVFNIPGLGLYFVGAAASRDMPLLMGATMFFALILMLMNLLVDLAYGYLNPRIRFEGGRG